MLQLEVEKTSILKVGSILAKHNVEASITDQRIIINGAITDQLLSELQPHLVIDNVKNFEEEDDYDTPINECDLPDEYDSLNLPPPEVIQTLFNKRRYLFYGGIYLCDFGIPFDHEIGYIRPAIIVRCPWKIKGSNMTIVVPCTTTIKDDSEMIIRFSPETTLDCSPYYMTEDSSILIDQVKTVSVKRIKKYIGVLKPEIMEEIQERIRSYFFMHSSKPTEIITEKPVEKIVEVPVPEIVEKIVEVPVEVTKETASKKYRQDINLDQLQILSLVNVQDLFDISKKYISDEEKASEMLKLFGFDLNANGVQYLIKAIVLSPRDTYFNLETLVEELSKTEEVSKEKIKNSIVARIKETLKFKKSPTISFIRLINIFLQTGGLQL